MQRTIEWGNVAKRGKRLVNPRGASEKLTPQPLDGWPKKIQSDGNGSCMVPVAVPASMLRGGIASNSMAFSQTPTEGPIADSIVLGTIYLLTILFLRTPKKLGKTRAPQRQPFSWAMCVERSSLCRGHAVNSCPSGMPCPTKDSTSWLVGFRRAVIFSVKEYTNNELTKTKK